MSVLADQRGCTWRAGSKSALFCLIALLLAVTVPALGQVEDDLATSSRVKQVPHGAVYIQDAQIGFSESGRNLVRADYYAPTRISLYNRSGEIFTGTIQIIGHDRDGETVIYERAGIGIKPSDSADIVMPCFIRNSSSVTTTTGDMTVRLLDKDGKLAHSLDVTLDYASDNEYLIVDISPRSIKGAIQGVLQDDPKLKYRGRVRSGYMRAADLPTSWYDLEAADVIVCDQPEDARLGVDQWNALAQWVRQGGLLVLGPGSMQSLEKTDMAKELPATAETMAKITPADFRAPGTAGAGDAEAPQRRGNKDQPQALGVGLSYLTFNFLKDIGVWQLKPRQDAATLLELPLKRGNWPIVVRRHLGEGAIVQSTVALSFLLSPQAEEGLKPGQGTRIKPELFGIRTLDTNEDQLNRQDMSWSMPWPNQYGPAELIKGDADFRAAGTVLATLLMLLTIIYGMVVTVGTWLVLRRRKLTQHSWLAFGAVAVIGSVGAAFLVQSARGIRAEVKQQAVVDLDAGTGMASVRTFYGLRMPYDAKVEIGLTANRVEELPPEQAKEAYIRPAADLTAGVTDSFAVRRDYTIRYGQNVIKDVPIRATAKQFESYWYGPLGGTIQGQIVLENNGQRLSSRSWLSNQTDMPLRECILVFSNMAAFNPKIRSAFITVTRIGSLPAGKVRNDLTAELDRFSSQPGMLGGDSGLDKIGLNWVKKSSWNVMQGGRYGSQAGQGVVDRSDTTQSLTAAMVTLLSDLPSNEQSGYNPWGGSSNYLIPFMHLPRSGGRWLDMRNVLDGKAAILIGLADSNGPTRMKVNGKAVEPSTGECIVRAVVPLVGTAN